MRIEMHYEDRTGGALHRFVINEANARRSAQGKHRLAPLAHHVSNNDQLVRKAALYLERRYSAERVDHLFYVVDGHRLGGVNGIADIDPNPNSSSFESDVARLVGSARSVMESLARGSLSPPEWQINSVGFHPHVLLWERESLLLPVLELLTIDGRSLGPSLSQSATAQKKAAAAYVKSKVQSVPGAGFSKAATTKTLLNIVADDVNLRATICDAVPSVDAIVAELVALP